MRPALQTLVRQHVATIMLIAFGRSAWAHRISVTIQSTLSCLRVAGDFDKVDCIYCNFDATLIHDTICSLGNGGHYHCKSQATWIAWSFKLWFQHPDQPIKHNILTKDTLLNATSFYLFVMGSRQLLAAMPQIAFPRCFLCAWPKILFCRKLDWSPSSRQNKTSLIKFHSCDLDWHLYSYVNKGVIQRWYNSMFSALSKHHKLSH